MQTTLHVPASLTYGPAQKCSGLDYRLADVEVQVAPGTCPTFVVYTPPHDIAVPSTNQTYVVALAQQPITMITFECATRWLLFLPIGTQCVAGKDRTVGTVQSLLARPCAPQN
jgi:hypothetical protein